MTVSRTIRTAIVATIVDPSLLSTLVKEKRAPIGAR